MSRIKTVFAVAVLAAMTVAVPNAHATAKAVVAISGSSAMWQTIALAAYNDGLCVTGNKKVKPPCFHYTTTGNFNVNDTRPLKVKKGGGTTAIDGGGVWIVWDSAATKNVWVYAKVDSVVGDRCFFAQPVCTISATSGYNYTVNGNKISSALWGGDTTPPVDVQALFTTGTKVNTAATDIRPEDGAFAACRVNSVAGSNAFGDGLDGLGYNANNASGICPQYDTTISATARIGKLVGTPIKSGIDTTFANVLAFNISGHDPFTNTAIPAYTTISVGQAPIVFVVSKIAAHGLANVTNATAAELQTIFSGTDCDAHILDNTQPLHTGINAVLREPLSGTMNTTEASVFRRPVQTSPNQVIGVSQETGVFNVTLTNPLSATACASGTGTRTRAIGTSQEVATVKAGGAPDAIGYTFFSFGNVSSLAGANYGYLKLEGVDGIGTASFPQVPTCIFPCSETSIWGGASFPHLRDGTYSAWSLLRMVTTTLNAANVQGLVDTSQAYVVADTPDYVPAETVPFGCTSGCTDNGLLWWHTHYQQLDGAGNNLGPAGNNGNWNATTHNPTNGDAGGDMGGCTVATTTVDTPNGNTTDVGNIQEGFDGGASGTACLVAGRS